MADGLRCDLQCRSFMRGIHNKQAGSAGPKMHGEHRYSRQRHTMQKEKVVMRRLPQGLMSTVSAPA